MRLRPARALDVSSRWRASGTSNSHQSPLLHVNTTGDPYVIECNTLRVRSAGSDAVFGTTDDIVGE